MKYLLALCIPAVWIWGITLAIIIREYFNDVIFKDFSLFIVGATILFPAISFAVTVILVQTIITIRK